MNPKIKIIGRYGEYRIGEIIRPPGSLRKIMIDLKVAELVPGQLPQKRVYAKPTPRKRK